MGGINPNGSRRKVLKAIGGAAGASLVAKPVTADGNGTYVGVVYNPETGEIIGEANANMRSVNESLKGALKIDSNLVDNGIDSIPISKNKPTMKEDLSRKPGYGLVGYDHVGVSGANLIFQLSSIQDSSISGLLRPIENPSTRQAVHLKKAPNGASKRAIRSDVQTIIEHHVKVKNVKEVKH